MPGPVVSLGEVACAYRVPAGHPDAAGVAARADAAVRPRLADACAAVLDALLDPADPSVWVLPRVSVSATVRLGAPDDVARRWALALARAVLAVVHGDAPAHGAVRYRDRAAWLASFAVALATGTARDDPAYALLAGTAALPPGRALVTAAESFDVGMPAVVAALARDGGADRVLASYGSADAVAVWTACAAAAPSVAPEAVVATVRERLLAALAATPRAEAAAVTLRVLATTLATQPGLAAPAAVAALAAALDRLPARPAEPATDAPAGAAPRHAPVPAAAPPPRPTPQDEPADLVVATPYAGTLLVLAAFAEVAPEEAAFRYRALVACAGTDAATGDPVLKAVAGLDPERSAPDLPDPPSAVVRAALRAALVAADRDPALADAPAGTPWAPVADAALRLFALRLPGFTRASPEHLRANVTGRGGVVRLAPDVVEAVLDPPPLEVVLRLAGLADTTFVVPWLGRPVRVRLAT